MIITRKQNFKGYETYRPIDPRIMARERHEVWGKKRYPGDNSETMAESFRHVLDELFTDYAFPGGYTIEFVIDESGEPSCADCAKKYFLTHRETVITCGLYDEGPNEYCYDCGKEIASSYGDPDEQD